MTDGPRRILVFQNRFRVGGQERQTVLHLRSVDRRRFELVLALLHLDGEHLADVAAAGIRPVVFDVGNRMLRPGTAWQLARLVRFVRAERIAAIHAQDVYTNVLGVLAARLAGVPAVVTRVDLGHHLEGYRRPLLELASRRADRVLVNALCIRDLALREGVASDRVVVVRNGVDLEELDQEAVRAPDRPAPPPGGVICVANMHHPVKGQGDLLLAMREVGRVHPTATLVLVGDGVRRPALEREARRLGIAARCHFLGQRRDAPALLTRADVAVSASYAEGISNAILEAMAARRPVVATAVGGSPELVRDGVNGFLVPPGAPAALAARIGELLPRPSLRRVMGEAGRRIVAREFSLEQMRASYEGMYEALAETAPPITAGAA